MLKALYTALCVLTFALVGEAVWLSSTLDIEITVAFIKTLGFSFVWFPFIFVYFALREAAKTNTSALLSSTWISFGLFGGLWAALTFAIGIPLTAARASNAAAGIAVLLVAIGVAAALIPLFYASTKVTAIVDRLPIVKHPKWLGTIVAVFAVLGCIVVKVAFAEIWTGLPTHLLGLTLGGGIGYLTANATSGRPNHSLDIVFGMTVALVSCAVFIHFEKQSLPANTSSALARDAVATILDADGDNEMSWFGESDCSPENASINSFATEIPNNGKDEDCDGKDLIPEFIVKRSVQNHESPTPLVDKPHIFLITTDALSFRRTSLARTDRDTTPNLKAWAERATTYSAAFSISSSTRISMPGLVLGKYGANTTFKRARSVPWPYSKTERTMAQRLKSGGYATTAVLGDKYFNKWKTLHRGFDQVIADASKKADNPDHTAPYVTENALRLLDSPSDKPRFMWLHYYDHHGPYVLNDEMEKFGTKLEDTYDSELHWTDKHWIKVIEKIESMYEPNEYMIIFTSDHGEVFTRTTTTKAHSVMCDQPVLHVPIIVQSPAQRGETISTLTSHLDILPTIAHAAKLKPDALWPGKSLFTPPQDQDRNAVFSLRYLPEHEAKKKPFKELAIHTDHWFARKVYEPKPFFEVFEWRPGGKKYTNPESLFSYVLDEERKHILAQKKGKRKKRKKPKAKKAEKTPNKETKPKTVPTP